MEEKARIRNECEINVCSMIILNTDFRAKNWFFFQSQFGTVSAVKTLPKRRVNLRGHKCFPYAYPW